MWISLTQTILRSDEVKTIEKTKKTEQSTNTYDIPGHSRNTVIRLKYISLTLRSSEQLLQEIQMNVELLIQTPITEKKRK